MANETEFGRTVTAEEAAFIAYRLRGHAKAQQKRLAIAMRKGLNPQLIKRMSYVLQTSRHDFYNYWSRGDSNP